MYEELVAWLRSWSELPAHCECYESCGECNKQDICSTFTNERIITKAGEAADAIEDLSRENESLAKSVNEASEILRKRWIPVTEELPEEYKDVLCYYEYFRYGEYNCMFRTIDRGYYGGGRWGGEAGQGHRNKVLAWMPLPEPPKEE